MLPQQGTLCTGDLVSPVLVSYTFQAPPDTWVLQALIGLLSGYNDAAAWTQCGTETPQGAADIFSAAWESLQVVSDIGTIIMFAGIAPPSNTLPCDGSLYNASDYPQLYATIRNSWGGVSPSTFRVPDLRGRVAVGAGQGTGLSDRTLADSFGEEVHTLTEPEAPSHFHTDAGHTHTVNYLASGVALTPGELPVAIPTPIPSVTGIGSANISSEGGGGAHNNMQPSTVVLYAIRYK